MDKFFSPDLVPDFTRFDFFALCPSFILMTFALAILVLGAYFRTNEKISKTVCFIFTFLGLALALLSLPYVNVEVGSLSSFMHSSQGLKGIYSLIVIISLLSLGAIFIQSRSMKFPPEFFVLFLIAVMGMYFIVFSKHLILTFTALEIMSLSVYILVSMNRGVVSTAEAGFKYFILGGLSACFVLYGFVLLFGATGSFDVDIISQILSQTSEEKIRLAHVGSVLVLCGLFFKIGAFPFHSWVPDVYQGSPSSLTAWMSSAVKFASFVILGKFAMSILFLPALADFFKIILSIVAVLTMFAGNIVALQQYQLKRMLAYSSVAHTGYALVAVIASSSNPKSFSALYIYLFIYSLLSLTTFGIVAVWEKIKTSDISLEQITGLGKQDKIPALIMAMAVLGLAGIPLTGGFVGKFVLIVESISGRQLLLSFFVILAGLIGIYYYLRIIYWMYLRPSFEKNMLVTSNSTSNAMIVWSPFYLLLILNIVFGLFPGFMMAWLVEKL